MDGEARVDSEALAIAPFLVTDGVGAEDPAMVGVVFPGAAGSFRFARRHLTPIRAIRRRAAITWPRLMLHTAGSDARIKDVCRP